MKFKILKDEYWWGGLIKDAEKMPIDDTWVYTADLLNDRRTQTSPLFISSKGRYIWSEETYTIKFDKGDVTIESEYPVELVEAGETLREAYLAAMKAHFPFEAGMHTPREFYEHPQFNTWIELTTNQKQEDILKYAHEIVEHGYKPGILMIDDGWQIRQGTWEFNHDLIPDPKAMVKELHDLGFIVLIWVTPFVCPEGDTYLGLASSRSSENVSGANNLNHLLRTKDGKISLQHWWSGICAVYNFNLPDDRAHMKAQLDRLINEYGFDGFKFDGGSYMPAQFINGTDYYGGYKSTDLNRAWIEFGAQYKFHEYKDTWKMGGKPVIQRLFDKNHRWERNGLDCLIPHGCFCGLIGCPFICPDMVGGGEWTAFIFGNREEELFVRMAECSALFPMMQFSSLPWRYLSEEGQKICLNMAKLHESLYPEIEKLVSNAEKTGEPIIRTMEYQFPKHGYEKINDQFMLGDKILVSPVIKKGERVKKVHLPEGDWQDQTDGKIYHGGAVVDVPAPLDKLPWFRKVEG